MVRMATQDDLDDLARMLKLMAEEVYGEKASTEIKAYYDTIKQELRNESITIFIDSKGEGFCTVRDEVEPITPDYHRINILRAYLSPSRRKSRLYYQFYNKIFDTFPDYEIWGITEANSEHINTLDKRHELVAKIYKARRD